MKGEFLLIVNDICRPLSTPVGIRRLRDALRLCLVCVILALSCGAPTALAQNDSTKGTVITSDRLSFDYKRLIAIFEDNVVVVDPQVRMEADRMNVLFTEENAIRSVTSTGHVRMWQGDKIATCDRAIYLAHDGQLIMRGNASMKQGKDLVQGNEITVWINEDRVVVKPAKLVIHGGGKGQSNPLKSLQRKPEKSP
jgi:lipopolysaccharide export system protein LptA